MIISILIAVIVALLLIAIIVGIKSIKRKEEKKDVSVKIQKKGKSAILKEAEKKLAHDPHNIPSLETIGDIYYGEKDWEKVWNIYKTLYDISTAHPEIDIIKCALRMGIAAYGLGKNEDAVSALMLCIKKDPNNFDCNLFLGKALMKANAFDKAVYCFKKCKVIQPENNEVNMLLGTALYKAQKYRDCLPFLKRVLDENPGNKEVLFDMAVAMTECGMGDKALKVFMHLRPDPEYGPQACLEAGKMHERVKDFASAVNHAVKDALETVEDAKADEAMTSITEDENNNSTVSADAITDTPEGTPEDATQNPEESIDDQMENIMDTYIQDHGEDEPGMYEALCTAFNIQNGNQLLMEAKGCIPDAIIAMCNQLKGK